MRAVLWLESEQQEVLACGLELGVDTVISSLPTIPGRCRQLRHCMPATTDAAAAASPLPVDQSSAGIDALVGEPHPVQGGVATMAGALLDVESGAEVATWWHVGSTADLKALEAVLLAGRAPGGLDTLVMDATAWKVIPAENLVALVQAQPQLQLLAVVQTAQEAELMLGALEVGTHGVLLRASSCAAVRETARVVQRLAQAPQLLLEQAVVTRVVPVGMGERVCVDCAGMLAPGEGLLQGSFARGLFLVACEAEQTAYIASRPFRVNAGAVHSYVMGPGGRTSYLAELCSGAQVLAVAPDGTARPLLVGRAKIERRPLLLVEASTPDGDLISCLLQNAETVKLVAAATASGASSAGGGGQPWATCSVAELRPGDTVLTHRPASAARHMGVAVKEFIKEL